MSRRHLTSAPEPLPESASGPAVEVGTSLAELFDPNPGVGQAHGTQSDALARLAEAEDMLRAIAAGQVDAFVVSDDAGGHRVFTLSTADRPYRMFVENMRDGAATISSNGLILYANRRLAELLSLSIETIVGSPVATFVAGGAPLDVEKLRGPGGLGATVELDLVDGNGVSVPVLVGASPLEVDGEHLTCLTFGDLSAQKAQDLEIARLGQAQSERMDDLQVAQAALTEQATHDSLTGLPNRALLVDRIDQALAQARRSGRRIAVLFVDLDRFKHVNDTHGHAAGDVVLRRVAKQLVATLRPMDTVARIGGDEFAILAPDVDSHLHAVDIGTRIVAELASRLDPAEEGEPIAGSVGIAISVRGRGTAEIMLHEADTAMYQAKALGRGRAEVFDAALRRQLEERLAGQEMLQSALDDRRLIAYYQPIIDLSNGHVAGFEALARIAESDGAIQSPAAFMPVAEESGLIVPLGTHMLTMACDEANRWLPTESSEGPLTVAVNLSSRQFEAGDLPTLVRESLEHGGLDPGQLHLELTETAIMDLRPNTLQQLARIKDLGVEIGLDDFGTGYASLTHLRRLPLTFVKIDRSFVKNLETDREDGRIVSAVVDLAANLGLRSIAEGVETEEQLHRLQELGCDQAQGYLFARPMPPRDVPMALVDELLPGLVSRRDRRDRGRVIDLPERKEAKRFQAALLDAASQATIAADPAGMVVYWNAAAEEMYGWSAADAIGRDVRELISAENVLGLPDAIEEGRRNGNGWSGDCSVKRADGSRFLVYLSDTPVFDEEGKLVAIIEVSVDLSDRRAGEQAKRALSAIVADSGDAIFNVAGDGTFTSWNAAAEELFGYTSEEIIGQPISLLTPDEEAPEQAAVRDRLRAGGAAEHFETTRRRKDGSLVGVLISDSATLDEAGNVVGLSVVAHDLSVRRNAQRDLEVSERQLSEAQRIAHLGSFELDVATGELTWSAEHYRVLGVDATEVPTAELFVSMVHPDDLPGLDLAWVNATERGIAFSHVYRIIRADLKERWVRTRAVPQVAEDGTVRKMVGTLMDDTERIEAARDRQLLLSRLVTAQEEERQRIASDIHDDSLQKVAAASMYLDMLRADHPELDDDEGFTKAQKMLGRSIGSMRHLMFDLRPDVLDRDGLIPAIRLYLDEESQFDGSPGFHLEAQLSTEPSPDIRIVLYRIVQEALVNVRKHARASTVEVWVGEQDGGYLVRVTDDGLGFDAGERAQSPEGHLGITAMRERADLAAGWFTLRSSPGTGTTVEFWVPRASLEQRHEG